MASIPTNPIPSAPKKDPCYSDAEGFQEVIRLAMKTDHQIYTKKTLAPCSFSLNAQRPGILDIIKAPYRLISTYTQKTKETLKDYSASLEKTQLRLLSQALHFLNALITPFSYISMIGIYILPLSLLTPMVAAIGFTVSAAELLINAYEAVKQRHFIHKTHLPFLKDIERPPLLKNANDLKNYLTRVLQQLTICSPQNNEPLIRQLISLHSDLLKDPTSFEKQKELLMQLFPSLQLSGLRCLLENLRSIFLEIQPKEKEILLKKSMGHYVKENYPDALYKSLSLIQNIFHEKKVALAHFIRPWLALETIQKVPSLCEKLSMETKQESLDLLQKISYNAHLKFQIHLTNVVIFSISLASYALSWVSPLIPLVTFAVSTVIYSINHIRIKNYLDNPTYKFKLTHCLPSWAQDLYHKITTFCHNHFSSGSHNATDLTSKAVQQRKSTT